MGLFSFDLSMGFAVGGLGLWGLGFRNQRFIGFRGLGLGFLGLGASNGKLWMPERDSGMHKESESGKVECRFHKQGPQYRFQFRVALLIYYTGLRLKGLRFAVSGLGCGRFM